MWQIQTAWNCYCFIRVISAPEKCKTQTWSSLIHVLSETRQNKKYILLLENLKPLKEANPDLILGFTGCLAQQEGEQFFEKMPFVDLVIGPDGVEHIVRVVDEVKEKKVPVIRTQFDTETNYKIPELSGETP